MLLESREYFFHCDSHNAEEVVQYSYFLSSSFLNILRTLLPLYGYFEPSAAGRVKLVAQLKDNNEVIEYFGLKILNLFPEIYACKGKGHFTMDPRDMLILTFEGYKKLLCLQAKCTDAHLQQSIEQKKDNLFYGAKEKVEQLSQLLQFFVSCLESVCKIISGNKVLLTDIKKAESMFDNLISGQNAYRLLNLLDRYAEMERERWKIIGSKA